MSNLTSSLPPSYEACLAELHAGRVTCRSSADARYQVFNYAERVEFDDLWNDVNVWCRGIIFDVSRAPPACVAVPFKKFWNVNQRPETGSSVLALLGDPVDAREKLDGSLGVMFLNHDGKICVSTRGSLQSEQSTWASNWIDAHLSREDGAYDALRFVISEMGLTPLVEIIYAENRIVIPYAYEGLCALAMIERSSGRVLGLDECGSLFPPAWRQAKKHAGSQSVDALLEAACTLPWDHEGWVLRWSNGMMVKVKGADYLRIHRIRFGLTPKRIHEALMSGLDPTCVEGYPDEFMTELRKARDDILAEASAREALAYAAYQEALGLLTRKDQALLGKQRLPAHLTGVFFAFLDNDPSRARSLCLKGVDPDMLTHDA